MKTFFSVFFAILAAAAILITVFWAKSRLDGWDRAAGSCVARISAINAGAAAYSRAVNSTVGGSPEVQLSAAVSALQRFTEAQIEVLDVERELATVLEHKPFGLPLTTDERKTLETAKQDIQKHAEKPK